jgi:uncharacterized membrane protein YbhN (UPF0104 family)
VAGTEDATSARRSTEGPAAVAGGTGAQEGWTMDILLIVAIVLILLALLGFSGVWAALRTAAWWILVLAIIIFVLSIIF